MMFVLVVILIASGGLWLVLTVGATFLAPQGAVTTRIAPVAGLLLYGVLNGLLVLALAVFLLYRWMLRPLMMERERRKAVRGLDLDPSEHELVERSAQEVLARLREAGLVEEGSARGPADLADEIRRLQAELAAAEKLAATGQIASGLAHEVGNPIGIIIGFAELLPREGKTGDYREKILAEANRIRNLIRQLLDLARPSKPTLARTDLRKIITETRSLLQGHPSFKGVEWEVDVNGAAPAAWADGPALKQVLVNVLLNAADAMPNGGRIKIEGLEEDGQCRLSISDTGEGIPPDKIDAIWRPFYTTKPGSKGSGLGLAICKRLVEQMQGRITAESRTRTVRVSSARPAAAGHDEARAESGARRGTTFHIRLRKA